DEQWQKALGGTGKDILKQIIPIKGGGYLIGGSTDSHPPGEGSTVSSEKRSLNYGNLDYWLIRLDNSGTVEWEKAYGGIYKDELQSIIETKDGGYLIRGYSNSPVSGTKNEDTFGEGDFWILKLDKNGNIQWQRT